MSKKSNLLTQDAFDLFIRKDRIKSISFYKKMVHFHENEPITVLKDAVDDYILWLRANTKANDITINLYLWSVRAFLYFCLENRYIPT